MQKLTYTRCGDYYIPDIRLPVENRSISKWGRMHRDYIKEYRPTLYTQLCLSGELWIYLANSNEQAQSRLELLIEQMQTTEGVTEELKASNQMVWVATMNNIRSRAEEIVKSELIYN